MRVSALETEAGRPGAAPTSISGTGTPTLHTAIGGALGVMFIVLFIALVFSPATLIDEAFIAGALGTVLIGGVLPVRQVDERNRLIHAGQRSALDRVTDYLVTAMSLATAPEKEAKELESQLEAITRELLRFENALSDVGAYKDAATVAEARRNARLEALRMWDEA
jgi:hypothetical protein